MSSLFVLLQESPTVAWILLLVIGGFAVTGWILYFRARSGYQASLQTSLLQNQYREAQCDELQKSVAELSQEVAKREQDCMQVTVQNAELRTRLESERNNAHEKLQFVEQARTALHDTFRALSHDALSQNNQQFLELAKTSLEKFHETSKGDLELKTQAIDDLIKPLKESLTQVDGKISELEKTRIETFAKMEQQIQTLKVSEEKLQSETQNLVRALRNPNVRGRWGEVQLRRVVELAGMVEHCDFCEQQSVGTEDGRLRPDLVVQLPNNKVIIVDSKVPLQAYLESIECADDDQRKGKLIDHARQVRNHVSKLGNKNYWKEFETNAEFAVLFLPGENLLSMALERDPDLIEHSANMGVILSTPMTLIALLRAVAYGWRQEQITKNALEISQHGKELYDRLATFAGHLGKLGGALGRSVESYNDAIGSLERKVLPSALRMRELGTTTAEEIEVTPIDRSVRPMQKLKAGLAAGVDGTSELLDGRIESRDDLA